MSANYVLTTAYPREDQSYVEIRHGKADIYDWMTCPTCGSHLNPPGHHEVVYGTEKFLSGNAVATGIKCTECESVHPLEFIQ